MRIVVLIIYSLSFLYSSNLSTLYNYYTHQEYDKGCDYGMKYYNKNRDNEKFMVYLV